MTSCNVEHIIQRQQSQFTYQKKFFTNEKQSKLGVSKVLVDMQEQNESVKHKIKDKNNAENEVEIFCLLIFEFI